MLQLGGGMTAYLVSRQNQIYSPQMCFCSAWMNESRTSTMYFPGVEDHPHLEVQESLKFFLSTLL